MLVALDPAVKKTGIAWFHNGVPSSVLVQRTGLIGGRVNDVYVAAAEMVARIKSQLASIYLAHGEPITLLIETPPPRGSYAPGLWMLHGLLYTELRKMPGIVARKGVSPMAIKSAMGTRKFDKKQTMKWVRDLMLSQWGITVAPSEDECEAVVLLLINNVYFGNEKMAYPFKKPLKISTFDL